MIPAEVSEKDFQQTVVDLARTMKWWVYHPYRSTRSEPGWLDLVLLRQGEMILAEIKTEKGRVTKEQTLVLGLLESVPGVESYVWRPRDFETIVRRLTKVRLPEPQLWPFCRVQSHERCTGLSPACSCACHQDALRAQGRALEGTQPVGVAPATGKRLRRRTKGGT